MLKRPSIWPPTDETIREEITLAEGETKQSRFRSWRTEKLATPRHCPKHPQEWLVCHHTESRAWEVYEEAPYGSYDRKPRPGVFTFHIELRCPACGCAYALCPPEFHTTSFETFDTSTPERADMLARARAFAAQVNQHGKGFALFVGPTGPGKTRLACNIVRELDNLDALYVRQAQLTAALRATYGRRSVEYDDEGRAVEPKHPLEITQSVRFLVLDEIGCTAFANDDRAMLDEVIKHRYDERKPTILISNLPLTGKPDEPGLKEFLGDALTDRIREATGNGKFILQFTGESYRRTTGEQYLADPG